MASSSTMTSDLPWAKGLKKSGLYYDGFVDDVEAVLEKHRKETVTFYGTRNSSGGVAAENDKENDNCNDNEVAIVNMDNIAGINVYLQWPQL